MSAQNVTARRRAAISGVAATVLLVFIAAFDNQWAENWRVGRIGTGPSGAEGNSWISEPVDRLNALAWRATKLSGESWRFYVGNLAAVLLAVVFTGLLVALVCRGVGAERGRWPLFLGTWLAVGLGSGLGIIAGVLIAGDKAVAPISKGTTYYDSLGSGFEFAIYAGWLVAFAAVLVYGSTAGYDEVGAEGYEPPSGYDYGSAAPAAYSYTPTSPYSGPGSGYGSGSGSGGPAGEPPTTVIQPQDPYGHSAGY